MSSPAIVNTMLPGRDPRMRRLELWISTLLRAGIIVSVSLIVVGMIAVFCQHPSYLSSAADMDRLVGPTALFPRSLDQLITGLGTMRGEALVILGLLVLIATPMMRVALSTITFIRQRDRTYAMITAVVLCLLLLSLVLGKAE